MISEAAAGVECPGGGGERERLLFPETLEHLPENGQAGDTRSRYSLHMKRKNLLLDERLLEEAVRLSGERTCSRTVQRALEDFVRRFKAGRILELAGSGLWEGDLSTMREDTPRRRRRSAR
jgi:Arc/MetJ family transcription regulator